MDPQLASSSSKRPVSCAQPGPAQIHRWRARVFCRARPDLFLLLSATQSAISCPQQCLLLVPSHVPHNSLLPPLTSTPPNFHPAEQGSDRRKAWGADIRERWWEHTQRLWGSRAGPSWLPTRASSRWARPSGTDLEGGANGGSWHTTGLAAPDTPRGPPGPLPSSP